MVELHPQREIDKWLKYAAIFGPFLGFLFGLASGAMVAYQAYKQDHSDIVLLFSAKEKQDEFNQKTVAAIARLKALIKDTIP